MSSQKAGNCPQICHSFSDKTTRRLVSENGTKVSKLFQSIPQKRSPLFWGIKQPNSRFSLLVCFFYAPLRTACQPPQGMWVCEVLVENRCRELQHSCLSYALLQQTGWQTARNIGVGIPGDTAPLVCTQSTCCFQVHLEASSGWGNGLGRASEPHGAAMR